MKRLLGIVLAVFFCSSTFAQGIQFEHGTFEEALAKAEKEDKLVFMDCYTTWCGPCELLAKKVFPQKKVGDFFNEQFVSVKMDMEKGEGIELLKKYEVKAFPTLLFIGVDGKVLHTIVGAPDAEGLVAEAKVALDPSQRIGALEERYARGERDVKFVSKYVQALDRAYRHEEMTKVSREFVANIAIHQLCNTDAFAILTSAGIEYNGKVYNYIIANKAKFIKVAGKDNVDRVIGKAVYNHLDAFIVTSTLEDLRSEIEKTKKDYISPHQKRMEDELVSKYYFERKEYINWFHHKKDVADKAMSEDKAIGSRLYTRLIYKVISDSAFLNLGLNDKIINMLKIVHENDKPRIETYYYLAVLYKREGNKKKALESINIFLKKDSERTGNAPDEQALKFKKEIENM